MEPENYSSIPVRHVAVPVEKPSVRTPAASIG
jgi:hypothetical protein